MAVDPDYYTYLGAKPGLGMSNSLAVVRMLLDAGIPKPFYPRSVVRKIALARGMLGLGPLVIIAAVVLFLRAS